MVSAELVGRRGMVGRGGVVSGTGTVWAALVGVDDWRADAGGVF